MRTLSQITGLNGYLSQKVSVQRLVMIDLENIVEPPIWHLLLRYRPVSVKRRLLTGDRG